MAEIEHDDQCEQEFINPPGAYGPCGCATRTDCPFCLIVSGRAPAEIVRQWDDAIAIVPLNPVTPGHVLVIPHCHVVDALESFNTSAMVTRRAAEIAPRPCNLITSVGVEATQTIRHLHLHIVPRRANDGLMLPWSNTEPDDEAKAANAEAYEWWRSQQ